VGTDASIVCKKKKSVANSPKLATACGPHELCALTYGPLGDWISANPAADSLNLKKRYLMGKRKSGRSADSVLV